MGTFTPCFFGVGIVLFFAQFGLYVAHVMKESDLAVPSPRQLAYMDRELQMFAHFGVNTYTGKEWGLGNEDPDIFQPGNLNTSQWVEVAKSGGFAEIILTVKHHDGFMLYPNPYTNHSVVSSSWRNGKGDVMAELVKSCAEGGILPSVYLSPWDRNQYNMTWDFAYNDFYSNTLNWLASNYGDWGQIWFDGANGGTTPPAVYQWKTFAEIIRKNQPGAVMGGCGGSPTSVLNPSPDCGPDSRWVCNEHGIASEEMWLSGQGSVSFNAASDVVWAPYFSDVSIRPGWFWHPNQDSYVKSLSALVDIYFRTVGRSAVLNLNVPPNDQGLIADVDAERVSQFGAYLREAFYEEHSDRLSGPLVASVSASSQRSQATLGSSALNPSKHLYWEPAVGCANTTAGPVQRDGDTGAEPCWLQVDFNPSSWSLGSLSNVVMLQEHVEKGQRIANHTILALTHSHGWEVLVEATTPSTLTTVGLKRLHRFDPPRVVGGPALLALRVRIDATVGELPVQLQRLGLFFAPVLGGGRVEEQENRF